MVDPEQFTTGNSAAVWEKRDAERKAHEERLWQVELSCMRRAKAEGWLDRYVMAQYKRRYSYTGQTLSPFWEWGEWWVKLHRAYLIISGQLKGEL